MDSCHMCQETLCHHVTARIVELQAEVERLRGELKHAKMYSTTDDVLEVRTEVERLRDALLKIHDRAGDRAFVFFESSAALEGE